ncbi:hypothetical protein [Thiocapsa imhoffii]|uniref:hypothetical protein n=1 Tax=Thiocapsa imhoffii TaxID=382777 RepID=UPI001F5BEEDA|nr:hypothetical protein [Thiocapsa imhoffii]
MTRKAPIHWSTLPPRQRERLIALLSRLVEHRLSAQPERQRRTPMSTVLSPVCSAPTNLAYGKIQSSHLQRQAVVYVRESTLQQVEHHQESTRL